jgi:hypothetical protein
MILAALAVAAALDAAPALTAALAGASGSPAGSRLPPGPLRFGTERTPNLYQEPAGCRDAPYRVVDRYGRPLPQKLGDLPRGAMILAVERTVGGCQVVTVAWGEAAEDQPNPPPQAYRAEPLHKVTPRRGDAPSNRR